MRLFNLGKLGLIAGQAVVWVGWRILTGCKCTPFHHVLKVGTGSYFASLKSIGLVIIGAFGTSVICNLCTTEFT